MESFKASNFKLSKVYGLPTPRGLLLFSILGFALWLSLSGGSETERWLFLLMVLMVLIHLIEASQPFRRIRVHALPFDPPFEAEAAVIPVQIDNPTDLRIETLHLRFDDEKNWLRTGPIEPRSSRVALLPTRFVRAGKQPVPSLVVKHYPVPGFFRFWRDSDLGITTFVLPRPVDHHIPAKPRSDPDDENELADIEWIRDPRLLPLADPKLFLKTGLPYRRVHRPARPVDQIALLWSDLDGLSRQKQGEQFSFWIQAFSGDPRGSHSWIKIDSPFAVASGSRLSTNWRNLKYQFAKWFYAQS